MVEACLSRETEDRPTCGDLVKSMRALLNEVGLVDFPIERRAFWKDPAVYQDELKQRLLPALLNMAKQAYQEHRIAVAIGHIDRILGLDEGNEEAIALLDQIERGQRAGTRMRAALIAAGLIVAGLLVSQFWPTGGSVQPAPVAHLSPTEIAPAPKAAPTPGLADSKQPRVPANSSSVDPLPEASPKVSPPTAFASFGSSSAPRSGAPEVNIAGHSPSPEAAGQRRPKKPRKLTKPAKTTRNPRKARPTKRAVPDASVPAEPAVETRAKLAVHGKHKGAEVFVDGKRHPLRYLFKLENVGGLELDAGQHTIVFRNPGCRDATHRVEIAVGQKKAPPIAFKCVHLPATLRVDSEPGLAVRLRGARNGTLLGLGKTNQDISVTMDAEKIQVGLILGDPDNVKSRRDVTLIAGKRKVVRVKL